MNISEFAREIKAEILAMPDPDAEILGGYCGDLLSWVMGRAESGQVWITIMTNINIVAVASLADVSAILLTESVEVDDAIVKKAEEQGINILRTSLASFDARITVSFDRAGVSVETKEYISLI